jgi:predicted nucleic acid-binding protein
MCTTDTTVIGAIYSRDKEHRSSEALKRLISINKHKDRAVVADMVDNGSVC